MINQPLSIHSIYRSINSLSLNHIVDVDECVLSPCKNEGLCQNSNGFYTCLCEEGWGGRNCDEGRVYASIKSPSLQALNN
jgi:hypothetical protein